MQLSKQRTTVPDVVQYEPATSAWRRPRARIIGRVAALVLLAAVTAVYWYGGSHSSGGLGFFSPDTLDAYVQGEILLPGTRLPIFRTPPMYFRYRVVTYLVDKGYWAPRTTGSPSWLRLYHTNAQWSDGKTDLYHELRWRGDEWIYWSDRHPNLAADLWPRVLARIRAGDTDRAQTLLFFCGVCEDPTLYHEMLTTLGEPLDRTIADAAVDDPK
jgi:hypothetical protein